MYALSLEFTFIIYFFVLFSHLIYLAGNNPNCFHPFQLQINSSSDTYP